jgi:hypothetical protein
LIHDGVDVHRIHYSHLTHRNPSVYVVQTNVTTVPNEPVRLCMIFL